MEKNIRCDMVMNVTELCDDLLGMVTKFVILNGRTKEYRENYDRVIGILLEFFDYSGMLENYNNANIYAGRYRVPPWMKGKLVKNKNKLIPPNLIPPNLTVCGYNLPQQS